jgi:hypothetical protein
MAAYGGGYGTASYRVYDVSYLEKQKKDYMDKEARCRLLSAACRSLVECYGEHAASEEREDCARVVKD